MNRAERRRLNKDKKTDIVTYNLTRKQLDDAIEKAVREKLNNIKTQATDDAINTSLMLMFILPIKVLMDHYWVDAYKEKIPEFADYIVEYYTKWQDDEYSTEELEKELWDLAGIKIGECER